MICRQVQIVNVAGTELYVKRSIGFHADDPLGNQHVGQIDLDDFAELQRVGSGQLEDDQDVVVGLRRVVAVGVSALNGRSQGKLWPRIPMTL